MVIRLKNKLATNKIVIKNFFLSKIANLFYCIIAIESNIFL